MGFLDKFLESMRVNDDDDYDDEYFDEEDEYEEPAPRARNNNAKKPLRSETIVDEEKTAKKPRNNTASLRRNAKTTASGNSVVVVKPTSVDESREITDTLLDNCTVVLNMEGLDMDVAQRIIDFASGSTYARAISLLLRQRVSIFRAISRRFYPALSIRRWRALYRIVFRISVWEG